MSDPIIVIRPGTVEDYPNAHKVIAETFAFHQRSVPEQFRETDSLPPTRERIEDLLRDEQGAWLLAEHEGDIVGFLSVRLRQPAQEPYLVPEVRVVVDNLGILPAWRRHGIGRHLMAAAEQWAREHGARRIMHSVWEFNTGALEFYETLGYATFMRNMWKAL